MQKEKWWSKYLCDPIFSPRWIREKEVKDLLQEHTEQIIKEIEEMKADGGDLGFNRALDAVINHLKKEI